MVKLSLSLFILAIAPTVPTELPDIEVVEVARWDFEERDDTNYDGWPDDWTRRVGHGFPHYVDVAIAGETGAQGAPGNRFLRIDLDGGAALVSSPRVAVTPKFSYVLNGRLRTSKLKHDVAYVSVTFCNGQLQPLETFESPQIRDAEDWSDVRIGPMSPTQGDIRWAVVALHLRPTDEADLKGTAMFDDLRLGCLPRFSLKTNSEHNVFHKGDPIEVTFHIAGSSIRTPRIRFELIDKDGLVLSQQESPATADKPETPTARPAPASTAPPDPLARSDFAGSATWRPPVPENGYYSVRVTLPGHAGRIVANLAVIEDTARSRTGEFGWSFPQGECPLPLRVLGNLLAEVGVHWAKFPVWYDERDKVRGEELAHFAEQLSAAGIQLVGVLDRPPKKVRELFGGTEPLPVASAFAEPALWRPAVDPVMTRLSSKVRWWQVGGDDDFSFVSFPDLAVKVDEIRRDLNRFGQEVNLGLPWRWINEKPGQTQPPWAFLSLTAAPPLTPNEVHAYLTGGAPGPPRRWLMLEPLRRDRYDLPTRATDLVQRMLAAKIARADAVFVSSPFDPLSGLLNENGSPGELLLPWRTTCLALSGAEHVGSLLLPQGSRNEVFSRGDEAVMVVWNEQPVKETLYLGDEVRQTDLWGRVRTPSQVVRDGSVSHEIEVARIPTIVTGLNAAIARWRIAFQFETHELASVFGQKQTAAYRFTNTFSLGVVGQLTVHTSSDWNVEPRKVAFKLAPGEVRRETLSTVLGTDASDGLQPIRFEVDVTADRNYRFSVYHRVHVGLDDVEIESQARLDEQGQLIVEQHLTNKSDRLVSFKCLLFVPDRLRERRLVFNLGQGRTTNVFTLPKGEELLGKTLWLRAEEIGGARILNQHIVAQE